MDKIQINEQILQLENIVAAMPGTIYWKDTEGRLLGFNNNQASKHNKHEKIKYKWQIYSNNC